MAACAITPVAEKQPPDLLKMLLKMRFEQLELKKSEFVGNFCSRNLSLSQEQNHLFGQHPKASDDQEGMTLGF